MEKYYRKYNNTRYETRVFDCNTDEYASMGDYIYDHDMVM